MKKLIALLLVLAFVLSLATVFTACGDDTNYSAEDDDDDDDDDDSGKKDPSDPSDPVTPLSDEDAAKAAIQAVVDAQFGTGTNIADLAPDVVWSFYAENYETTKDDMISKYPEYSAQIKEVGYTCTVTFGEVVTCPAEYMELTREEMSDYYGWEIASDAKAYRVSVTLNMTVNGDSGSDSGAFVVVKESGKWYVIDTQINDDYSYADLASEYVLLELASLANPDMGGWG